MGFNFSTRKIREFIDEIRNFKTNLVQFDVDRVKRESAKRFAEEMTDVVIDILVNHDELNVPATSGPYESGPTPSMATKRAWKVRKAGRNDYTVRPHPSVRQRAIVLNDGYGTIEPNGDDPMGFTINGVPRLSYEVEGPDAARYWQSAFRALLQSDKIDEIAKEELNEEADRAFKSSTTVIKE